MDTANFGARNRPPGRGNGPTMKKIILFTTLSLGVLPSQAQIFDRIRNKVQQKVNEKIDETVDQATRKKKKDAPAETPPADGPVASKPGETPAAPGTASSGPVAPVSITSYSRFDFIPGDKIIIQEDFAQDAVGDFPGQWNTRSGAEVVTVSNRPGKWLRLSQDGVFYPEYLKEDLPENFTLTADIMATNGISNIGKLTLTLFQAKTTDEKFEWGDDDATSSTPNFKLHLIPKSSGGGDMDYSSNVIGSQHRGGLPQFNVPVKNHVRLSLWRQKQRVRVYLDSTKVLDLPRALDAGALLNSLAFSAYAPDFDKKDGAFFVGNIQLAVGAPDTRNKLITEGKFSTRGITFGVNSADIRPESFGTLQDIANVLKENASVRVKVVGHTDSDGADAANLDLSKRRAESVRETLATVFGIPKERIEADGKGESEPADSNDTPAGKANNRRVEFIRL